MVRHNSVLSWLSPSRFNSFGPSTFESMDWTGRLVLPRPFSEGGFRESRKKKCLHDSFKNFIMISFVIISSNSKTARRNLLIGRTTGCFDDWSLRKHLNSSFFKFIFEKNISEAFYGPLNPITMTNIGFPGIFYKSIRKRCRNDEWSIRTDRLRNEVFVVWDTPLITFQFNVLIIGFHVFKFLSKEASV